MVQPAERADARANRARLLTAAIHVFAERGADAEMREIAERAGLAVGTVYNHFPSKEDLIAAVLGQASGEFERVVDGALAREDPLAGVRALLEDGLAVAERYGEVITAAMAGRIPFAHSVAAGDARHAALAERVTELIARGVAAGVFRPALDPGVAAAVLKSVFAPWTLAELRRSRTRGQIAAALLAIFLDGARAPRA